MSLESDRYPKSRRRDREERFYRELNQTSLHLRGDRLFPYSHILSVQNQIDEAVGRTTFYTDDPLHMAAGQLFDNTKGLQEAGAVILRNTLSIQLISRALDQTNVFLSQNKHIPKSMVGQFLIEFLEIDIAVGLQAVYDKRIENYQMDLRLLAPKQTDKLFTLSLSYRPKPKKILYNE